MRTQAEFKDFYEQYADDVAAFLHSYASNKAQLKDWVHDVFIKMWDARESINFDDPSIKGYLLTTARNHALKKLRKNKTYEEWLEHHIHILEKTTSQDDLNIHPDDRMAAYRQALQNVAPRSRRAYQLSREEGLTYQEISEVMDISIKTVESHITTALKILRDELKP